MSARSRQSRQPDLEDAEVLARIAESYYLRGKRQEEIAAQFNISRSYVSRLLDRARARGIVEISIRHPVRTESLLEDQLRRRFGLKECIVVVAPDGAVDPLKLAGEAGADYLCRVIEPDHTLGVSWGTGVKSVIEALKCGRARARHVVPLFGGLTLPTNDISGADLGGRLARALGASFQYLHAPWIVESAELAQALKGQPDVAVALRQAASADIAYVGIGSVGTGSSALLFNATYLNRSELRELPETGAVGDICGRLFDAEGKPCPVSFDDRIIGIDLPTLKQIPIVVGIATGAQKARAINAALRGGLVDVLVTDREGVLPD
jgi:DNA-binding transcriptional regulator LsrR (DeoR family)